MARNLRWQVTKMQCSARSAKYGPTETESAPGGLGIWFTESLSTSPSGVLRRTLREHTYRNHMGVARVHESDSIRGNSSSPSQREANWEVDFLKRHRGIAPARLSSSFFKDDVDVLIPEMTKSVGSIWEKGSVNNCGQPSILVSQVSVLLFSFCKSLWSQRCFKIDVF